MRLLAILDAAGMAKHGQYLMLHVYALAAYGHGKALEYMEILTILDATGHT